MPLVLLTLTLLASLSPLLTFAWLWQVKEWRWDRLREELVREKTLLPLMGGKLRPLIFLVYLALLPVVRTGGLLVLITLGVLTALTLGQIGLRRQRTPVWTMKALTVIGVALLGDIAVSVALLILPRGLLLLTFLPLLQTFMAVFALNLLWPLDRFLKRKAFAQARALRARHPELLVIGITGSVGKTTTKELLTHILADRKLLATPAHVNTEMGIARWLQANLPADSLPDKTPLLAEMGAYRSGEIALLCSILQPAIGIVTFIGSQHLALFGSQDALIKAKGELLQALPGEGRAFLNGDSEMCRGMQRFCRCPVTVVGTGGPSDLEAYDIEETPTGIRFTAGDVPFSLPLHGTHNVVNVLLAIAAAEHLGMQRRAIADRIRTFRPLHQTFEVRKEHGVTILDDTHNSSAASFKAAIAWAKTQPIERRFLLAAGIIELGEEHERTHRELGALASTVFEQSYFLSPKSGRAFAEGFGKPVSGVSNNTPPLPAGSLLVCVGRMSPSTIRRLLPLS